MSTGERGLDLAPQFVIRFLKRGKGMSYPKRPSKLLIKGANLFLKGHFKYHRLTIDKRAARDTTPPFIVVFNHVGNKDYLLTGNALLPRVANNMAARWVQYDKKISSLTLLAGGFFKNHFYPDAQAILCCKKVLRRRKGIVCLSPSGVHGIDGTLNFIEYSTPKLFKLFKVPVIACKLEGVSFYANNYRERHFRGKLFVKTSLLFTPQECAQLSEKELYQRLWQAIDFNDFEYREKENFLVEGKDLAEGMQFVLYKCLKCGKEFTIEQKGNDLICSNCKNAVTLKGDMCFYPKDKDAVYINRLDKWNLAQKRLLRKEILKEDFCINDTVSLYHNNPKKKYGFYPYGRGVMTLNRQGLTYKGSDDGKEVEYFYPLESIPNVAFQLSKKIMIERDGFACFYFFDEPRKLSKLVQSYLELRLALYPDFEGQKEWLLSRPNENLDTTIYGKTLCKEIQDLYKDKE